MNLIEKLSERGVDNPINFGKEFNAPAWIIWSTQHPHAMGHGFRRATLYYRRDGKVYKREFRADLDLSGDRSKQRAEAVERAQLWAEKNLEVSGWTAGPFQNSWQLTEVRLRVQAELDKEGGRS